eukprot:10007-Heterococcus_DN1.PRE.4
MSTALKYAARLVSASKQHSVLQQHAQLHCFSVGTSRCDSPPPVLLLIFTSVLHIVRLLVHSCVLIS